jgi:hypothetical protein
MKFLLVKDRSRNQILQRFRYEGRLTTGLWKCYLSWIFSFPSQRVTARN